MSKAPSKGNALLQGKCPRCRKGKIFAKEAYNLSEFSKMNPTCPNCHLSFEVEPGFYTGAMYISYAFNVALLVVLGIALAILFMPPVWVYFLTVSLASLILLPWVFRYSRILFLYFFGGIEFDPNTAIK